MLCAVEMCAVGLKINECFFFFLSVQTKIGWRFICDRTTDYMIDAES